MRETGLWRRLVGYMGEREGEREATAEEKEGRKEGRPLTFSLARPLRPAAVARFLLPVHSVVHCVCLIRTLQKPAGTIELKDSNVYFP